MPTATLDFAQLFRDHYASVYRYVRYRIDDDLIAEDLTSEIFERAFRYRHTFQPGKAAFSTWIGRIAQNWVNNYLKSHQHRMSTSAVDEAELDNVSASDSSPEAHVIGQEALGLLRRCLDLLKDRDREIVMLRFGMNTGNKEIADMLDLKEHSVSVMLMRALDRLRGCQEAT